MAIKLKWSGILAASMLLIAALSMPSAASSHGDLIRTAAVRGAANTLPGGSKSVSALPIAAQSAISASLGRVNNSYHLIATNNGFVTGNHNAALDARFGVRGVAMNSRGAKLRMRLLAYGHGDAIEPVGEIAPRAKVNRVYYRYGSVIEWYVNGPFGIEQGFTLARAPKGNGALELTLAISGDLTAHADLNGEGAMFMRKNGAAALRYTGLLVRDSNGRDLKAWIATRGSHLTINVDDSHAAYPITIDPFVQVAALTTVEDDANDNVGWSVAVSGDTVVVGAPGAAGYSGTAAGAAYVFVKPSAGWGNMTETAKLVASDGLSADYFGNSVAINGGTIVVGAPYHGGMGAAYVFVEPAGGWSGTLTQNAELTASDEGSGDAFGSSVAVSGTTIVVGAPHHSSFTGAVYVFAAPIGGWSGTLTQNAELSASDGGAFNFFANSVAIDGGTIVVGAQSANKAYVFTEPIAGWTTGTQNAELTASDTTSGFGASVAISGNTVAIGAPGGDNGDGSVYVFAQPTTGWANMTETAELTASDEASGDSFGESVGISGGIIVVGASGHNSGAGAAYAFVEPAGGWTTTTTYDTELSSASGGTFGFSSAIDGDTIAIGARSVNSAAGEAYVFQTASDTSPPAISITSPTDTDYILKQPVVAGYSCTPDEVGDTVTCMGTVPSGSDIDTSAVGSYTFIVDSQDGDSSDAIATQKVPYTVIYGVTPLFDQTNPVHSGAVLPVKLELTDYYGNDVSSSSITVNATGIEQISTAVSSTVQDAGNSNPDSNFRYDSSFGTTGGYIFNLSTKGLSTGTYLLQFRAGSDPTVHTVQFEVH